MCSQSNLAHPDTASADLPLNAKAQGFPDNHTSMGNYDGEVKTMSNTQRYKQCGNAVTVDDWYKP